MSSKRKSMLLHDESNTSETDFQFATPMMMEPIDLQPQRMPKCFKRMLAFVNHVAVLFLLISQYFLFYKPNVQHGSLYLKGTKPINLADMQMQLDSLYEEVLEVVNFMHKHLQELDQIEIKRHVIQLQIIDNKIREALSLYDADKLGMIDYALESAGAVVTSTPNTKPYPSNTLLKPFSIFPEINLYSNPKNILQPETLPGRCFAFFGANGRIRIRLSRSVRIQAVTLEHAPSSLLDDIRSAPKEFVVYGLDGEDAERGDELGQFAYSIEANPLQTFQVDDDDEDDDDVDAEKMNKKRQRRRYGHVELHILSNYGHPEYTCVYRFRIHGTPN